MSRLVMQPSVHVIASTVMNPSALTAWAEANGLSDIVEDDSTPLGRIFEAIVAEQTHTTNTGNLGNASLDRLAETAGRHCYRSWDKGRDLGPYIENIIESGHSSVLRHGTIVLAISGISRSLSLELIRHHIGADPSQESQRYVEASEIRFVVPPLLIELSKTEGANLIMDWSDECERDRREYARWIKRLKKIGGTSDVAKTIDKKRFLEAARSRLPNCSETRMVWTMNMNSMRNIIAARGSVHADLEIRRLALEFLEVGKLLAPRIFEDFRVIRADDGFDAIVTPYPKL